MNRDPKHWIHSTALHPKSINQTIIFTVPIQKREKNPVGGECGEAGAQQQRAAGAHLQVPDQRGDPQVQRELGQACGSGPLLQPGTGTYLPRYLPRYVPHRP